MTSRYAITCLSLAALAVLAVTAQDWLLTWLLFVAAVLAVSGLAWEARRG